MKTRFALLALLGLALPACSTVKVQGYEVTGDSQVVAAAVAIAGGALLYSLAERSDTPESKDQSRPGEIVCRVDMNTGECVT